MSVKSAKSLLAPKLRAHEAHDSCMAVLRQAQKWHTRAATRQPCVGCGTCGVRAANGAPQARQQQRAPHAPRRRDEGAQANRARQRRRARLRRARCRARRRLDSVGGEHVQRSAPLSARNQPRAWRNVFGARRTRGDARCRARRWARRRGSAAANQRSGLQWRLHREGRAKGRTRHTRVRRWRADAATAGRRARRGAARVEADVATCAARARAKGTTPTHADRKFWPKKRAPSSLASAAAVMARLKLIIDTDPGVDDALAIFMAFNSSEVCRRRGMHRARTRAAHAPATTLRVRSCAGARR
jgi:hypothetical protein